MVSALGDDDYVGGFCENGSFPIVSAMYAALEDAPAPEYGTTLYAVALTAAHRLN